MGRDEAQGSQRASSRNLATRQEARDEDRNDDHHSCVYQGPLDLMTIVCLDNDCAIFRSEVAIPLKGWSCSRNERTERLKQESGLNGPRAAQISGLQCHRQRASPPQLPAESIAVAANTPAWERQRARTARVPDPLFTYPFTRSRLNFDHLCFLKL